MESFEGVLGKDLSNPIPGGPSMAPTVGSSPTGREDMNTPYPDPGEEYQHVNTQLFGHIDPPENRACLASR